MANTTIETPDWLREMETILEKLNEGVVVVDDQLRVTFAIVPLTDGISSSAIDGEVPTRMGHFKRSLPYR